MILFNKINYLKMDEKTDDINYKEIQPQPAFQQFRSVSPMSSESDCSDYLQPTLDMFEGV